MVKRDFESTNPASLKTAAHDDIVTAYAVVYTIEADLWQLAHDLDAWEDPNVEAARARVQERLSDLLSLYHTRFPEACHSVSIRGNFSKDYYGPNDNYTVDDTLRKEFGDHVCCDSESGWFVVDVTPVKAKLVEGFIRTHFPSMEFTMDELDMDELRIPTIGNWSAAKAWLRDRTIVVDYELPSIQPKSGRELKCLLHEARVVLQKTGLPMEEAIKLL